MKTETITGTMNFRTEGSSALKMEETPHALKVTHLAAHAPQEFMHITWVRAAQPKAKAAKPWIILPTEIEIL